MNDANDAECETCQIPGAPSHEPSRKCHYLTRGHYITHCTCAACWG